MADSTPKYNVKELQSKIDEYFESNPEKPTVTGLAHFLGFVSRQSMYDYQKRKNSSYTVKRAILFIESLHEERLYGNSPTGSIFWLKNRDWRDKQETEHSGSVDIPDLNVNIIRK